jgi:hypothetical protein
MPIIIDEVSQKLISARSNDQFLDDRAADIAPLLDGADACSRTGKKAHGGF